jgi:hypothetical protein
MCGTVFLRGDPRISHVYFETKISTTTVHWDPTTNNKQTFSLLADVCEREIVARAVIDFEKNAGCWMPLEKKNKKRLYTTILVNYLFGELYGLLSLLFLNLGGEKKSSGII